jgi:CRP-like cAMP-binding protein
LTDQTFLQEKLNAFLAGEYRALSEPGVAGALPPTLVHLLETSKERLAEKLVECMIDGFRESDAVCRSTCGTCLVEAAAVLADKEMWGILDRMQPSLRAIRQEAAGGALRENVGNKARSVLALLEKKGAASDPVAEREGQIFQLYHAGNKEQAKQQLFELIVSCARQKDFPNAERLRERLYDIDSMALMEIIQSGEIIEEEKSGSIDRDILHVWSSLLQVLTTEEFNALYHAMEKRTIKPEEVLVSQGAKNDALFFIHRGGLRVSYYQTGTGGGKEIFLKNLHSGDIAGENFFNATVWTVSLTSVPQSDISVLTRKELARLEQKNPGIESKLRDYYARTTDIAGLLNRKGLDRRVYERYRVERRIHLQITGKTGQVLSSFRGDMDDISQGGLSFMVRITRKENSRLLLGRKIRAAIPLSAGGEQQLYGTVIGVQFCDPIRSDYSVHVRFDRELDRSLLQQIIT